MFSALKRLAGSSKVENAVLPNNGSNNRLSHQSMSQNLQRKFSKGIQYNSKTMFLFKLLINIKIYGGKVGGYGGQVGLEYTQTIKV